MELTEQEKMFVKHFLGAMDGLTAQNITNKALDGYQNFEQHEEWFEFMQLLEDKSPLDYMYSIYLKAKG